LDDCYYVFGYITAGAELISDRPQSASQCVVMSKLNQFTLFASTFKTVLNVSPETAVKVGLYNKEVVSIG